MSMIAPGDQHATTAKGLTPPNSGSGGVQKYARTVTKAGVVPDPTSEGRTRHA